jgi:hypothetical protein
MDHEKDGITVAIVTARANEHTSYKQWRSLRNAFLSGQPEWHTEGLPPIALGDPDRRNKYLSGEFGALLGACLATPAKHHHIEYQLRALELQTRRPDHVMIISRVPWPGNLLPRWSRGEVSWIEPMVSTRELEAWPESAFTYFENRRTDLSFGCNDKNTAIVACRTPYLIMLDDCCLPGFGLVEAGMKACEENHVMLFGHRKVYLPSQDNPNLAIADANFTLQDKRGVFGIWAAPVEHLLAINGFNTALDTSRGGLDEELKLRMDRYMQMRSLGYTTHSSARVYEIEHEHPWDTTDRDWQELCPDGFWAPGPNLKSIREAVLKRFAADDLDLLDEDDFFDDDPDDDDDPDEEDWGDEEFDNAQTE